MQVQCHTDIMFDNDPSIPASGSYLSKTLLRVRCRDQWPAATGFVYSAEWRGLSGQGDSPVGYYDVVFSYRVNDQLYSGRFSDYGMEVEDYLHKDDTIEIRYDPSNPEKNYYPLLRTATNFRLLCGAIGAAIAIIVMLIAHFRSSL
jgi:hypothetical protein